MQRVAAGTGVVLSGSATGFDRIGSNTIDDKPLLNHARSPGEGGLDRGLVAGFIEISLVFGAIVIELGRARLERLARRHHRWPRCIVDRDVFGRIAGMVERVGNHHSHRIADVAYPIDCNRRPFRHVHRAGVAPLVGRHRRQRAKAVCGIVYTDQRRLNPGHGQRGAHVDATDVRVRVGRAHDRGVELMRKIEIVEIASAPHQQPRILPPPHRLAD